MKCMFVVQERKEKTKGKTENKEERKEKEENVEERRKRKGGKRIALIFRWGPPFGIL